MNYFPDVSNHDLSTSGGMALYLAHCDLDPILGLIDHTELVLAESLSRYELIECQATKMKDYYTQSQIMDLRAIFRARIEPLSYESIILILISRVEEAFKTWCLIVKDRTDNDIPDFESFACSKHGALDKPIKYLKDYGHVVGIKADPLWDYITAICVIRNAIVHHGGRITGEKNLEKMERYNFDIFFEDNRIYLEIDTIRKIYQKVVEFIDRVFMIEPTQ